MERFTGNKDVEPYSLLSAYYDELLMDKESFQYWLDFIESKPFSSCLELASGTGVIASILALKGHHIIASDISSQMKNAARKNFDGDYRILNMTDYHLDEKFDLILCLVDSFNYLKENELDDFFACAYEHLSQGGRLIFDSHHPNRLKEFKEEYIEEGNMSDGNGYQWTISCDEESSLLLEHFTFYTVDGMIQEHHLQHIYSKELIEEKMNSIGFQTEINEDFIKDEKMLIIGRKL